MHPLQKDVGICPRGSHHWFCWKGHKSEVQVDYVWLTMYERSKCSGVTGANGALFVFVIKTKELEVFRVVFCEIYIKALRNFHYTTSSSFSRLVAAIHEAQLLERYYAGSNVLDVEWETPVFWQSVCIQTLSRPCSWEYCFASFFLKISFSTCSVNRIPWMSNTELVKV